MATKLSQRKQLRLFGVILSAVMVFWLTVYGFSQQLSLNSLWPGYCIASILFAIAIINPPWLSQPYRYWLKGAHGLNRLITATTLGICFFCIITPTAFIKRAFGNDAMFKPSHLPNSYRQNSEVITPSDMEHPF
ncbi:SxtJ family membrane protein [Oceanicoccus sagamiensis]|uniref:SxtJ n=1 Tax=Oceanicoccus sagamiensis TaxID=716816 RepID=A0A1X9NK15_9GAMM|nr:SxtJ family membrane protein [Oceanicoccus sagamiensis]ARN74313.1 hypothetical protein BST96_09365 [Oceanicoccus sagamiensis]